LTFDNHKKLFVFVLFLLAFPLFGRDVRITVLDSDLGLPLEGATVRSWDGAEYICDEDGSVIVSVPDQRQVVIQAAYPGYETGRLLVTAAGEDFTMNLRLSGILESRELVIEAQRPGESETRTGRSVAVSGRDIAQTGEIGIIEDVMSTISLLPGVGYSGFFNAVPSIRGGYPGDMHASLDGYYIFNPYYWGGGFSIFDPKMVQSAQLSHGVFSVRYGHTISGLLEVTSKKPSSTETQFELGINTSAANFSLSLPLFTKGGILMMGRVTYYDPVIWLAKQMSGVIEELDVVNYVRVAPYIRSTTLTGNYRFYDNLELQATAFFGMDGVGVTFENSDRSSGLSSDSYMKFDWTNYQVFLTTALSWNPRNDMLAKLSAGVGFEDAIVDGYFRTIIYNKDYSDTFHDNYNNYFGQNNNLKPYSFITEDKFDESDILFNAQGRLDYDWEFRDGLIFAAGVQELFNIFSVKGNQNFTSETWFYNLGPEDQAVIQDIFNDIPPSSPIWNYVRVSIPVNYSPNARNMFFTTSGYTLAEYSTPGSRFKTELGLRLDHFYLIGDGFTLQSEPALNPRLHMDFNILKNIGILQSLDISAGTGLFSAVDNMASVAEKEHNLSKIKPSRSWTSVFGTRLEFPEGLNFNMEFYYKYIFDRTYIPVDPSIDSMNIDPRFDGEGMVWGIDLMLQKLQSRFWDGWLSYSFSWAKYRDPGGISGGYGINGGDRGDDWYFPYYHRFHNLNLVFNYKPIQRINIYARFGLASGALLPQRIGERPESRPVVVYEPDNPANSKIIEKFFWFSRWDENNRTTPSIPLDIKFSIFGKNETGKARYELYVAIENTLALLYTSQGNTSFNQYTGEVETGSNSASYEIPIPIPSFGFKVSY